MSSNPAYGFKLIPNKDAEGQLVNIYKNLPEYSKKTRLFGETLKKPIMALTLPSNDIKERYGCPECQFKTQYQADHINWSDLLYTWKISLVPSKKNHVMFVDGVPRSVSYDYSYIKVHEEFHASSNKNLFDKIFGKVVEWANKYTAGWFNSEHKADNSWQDDFKINFEKAEKEYDNKKSELDKNFHDAKVYSAGFLANKGAINHKIVLDNQNNYVASVKDVDESWRQDLTEAINKYEPQIQLQTSLGEAPVACPGPLPLLGLGVAFRYSRKLRNKLRSRN